MKYIIRVEGKAGYIDFGRDIINYDQMVLAAESLTGRAVYQITPVDNIFNDLTFKIEYDLGSTQLMFMTIDHGDYNGDQPN